MTVETTEHAERKARVIGEDGEIFDSIEEYTAWVNDVKAQLARSEADREAGRVMTALRAPGHAGASPTAGW